MRRHHRQIGAGAVPAERDPRGIRAELDGMSGGEPERGDHVVDRRREGMLRSGPVVDGQYPYPGLYHEVAAQRVVAGQAAGHPTAAVVEDQQPRPGRQAVRGVEPGRQVVRIGAAEITGCPTARTIACPDADRPGADARDQRSGRDGGRDVEMFPAPRQWHCLGPGRGQPLQPQQ